MSIKNSFDKIKKASRKLKREALGESNRVLLVPEEYIPMKWLPAYADFYRHVASAPAKENRLEFAANRPLIEGSEEDVHEVRCLDHVIGRLTKSFNGAAGIPEKTLRKIYSHIADVSDALARIKAYAADGATKTPVTALEYKGKDGKLIATIRLG